VRAILQLILVMLVVILTEVFICVYFEWKNAQIFPNEKEEMKREFERMKKEKQNENAQFWKNIISYDHKKKGGGKE